MELTRSTFSLLAHKYIIGRFKFGRQLMKKTTTKKQQNNNNNNNNNNKTTTTTTTTTTTKHCLYKPEQT